MSRVQSSESGIAIDRLIDKAKRLAAPVEAPVRGKEVVVVVFPQRDYEQWRAIRKAVQSFATRPAKTPEGYLADTIRALRKYEKKYKMTSAEFYRRFQAGELGEDEFDYFDWRVEYNAYRRLKRRINSSPSPASQCETETRQRAGRSDGCSARGFRRGSREGD